MFTAAEELCGNPVPDALVERWLVFLAFSRGLTWRIRALKNASALNGWNSRLSKPEPTTDHTLFPFHDRALRISDCQLHFGSFFDVHLPLVRKVSVVFALIDDFAPKFTNVDIEPNRVLS